eukprot:scaffold8819_cov70-Isochrysis_galbana.AAC.2
MHPFLTPLTHRRLTFTPDPGQSRLLSEHESTVDLLQRATDAAVASAAAAAASHSARGEAVAGLCAALAPAADGALATGPLSLPPPLLPAFAPLLPTGRGPAADTAAAQAPASAKVPGSQSDPTGARATGAGAAAPASSFKEGALFVQAGMLRQWRRCWCVARDGVFTVHRLPASAVNTDTPGRDGRPEPPPKPLAELRLVLCSVKATRAGSRFYLQLRSPNAQLTLQALTEAGAQAWATFFAKAIEEAYGVGGG